MAQDEAGDETAVVVDEDAAGEAIVEDVVAVVDDRPFILVEGLDGAEPVKLFCASEQGHRARQVHVGGVAYVHVSDFGTAWVYRAALK